MRLPGPLAKLSDLVAKHAPSNAVRVRCQRAKGVRVGRGVYLGYDVNIDAACPELVEIDDHARLGIGVIVLAHNRPGDAVLDVLGEERAPVRIGRHAAVQAGAIVLPGVTIGEGAVVRPGAVVEDDVPPFTVVAGVPARMVAEVARATAPTGRPP
jgi:acetyltransferase-like isoleucine patch superfamily enzyme